VAMFLVQIVSRLAKRYRLVDAPVLRKVHQTPIPCIGGVAIIVSTIGLVLPVLFSQNIIVEAFSETRLQVNSKVCFNTFF